MKKPLPITVLEDYQAWEKYGGSDYRWAFNKLEVALRQGLHAGPAAVPPGHSGIYISRPTYNLYGMGIGAKQFSYSSEDYEAFVQHKEVPPGFFWCEWITGEHYSIDYQQHSDGSWRVASVWEGKHYSDSNLVKFRSWSRLSNRAAPELENLPLDLEWLKDPEVPYFNIEMRGKYITEIHLRPGDVMFNHLPVGATVFPIWGDGEAEGIAGEWMPDIDEKMSQHQASGNLTDIRNGFIIVKNNHQY